MLDACAEKVLRGLQELSRAAAEITLLDLATHRSALPRLPTNLEPADRTNPYADYSVERMYAFLSDLELERDIGSAFEYSNLGVGLLGHALSRAANVSYETLLQRRILEPLDMNKTDIQLSDEMLEWMAQGHNTRGSPVALWDIGALAAAGGLQSDVVDMLRFLDANIGEPASELEKSMRVAHAPQPMTAGGGPAQQSIGLNWFILSAGDTTIVWHNGGTGGFRSFIGFAPRREIGVVVLANSSHPVDDIGLHLLNPAIPLSAPRAQNAVWSTFAPPTAAAMAILLVALWGRFRNRHRVSAAARDRR